MKLSIIIPIFNEEKTAAEVLKNVAALRLRGVNKEIIVIDDGSTDRSVLEIKNQKSKIKDLKVFFHSNNLGKGAAVKTGLNNATGDYVVIQDADLEYDPKQIENLVDPVLEGKAQVVYGTRLNRMPNIHSDERTPLFLLHYLGNRFLSFATSILYFQWLTDMETCYKLFPRKAVIDMKLKARGFEFEPEITAKLLKMGFHILQIPITTKPRDYSQGRKLYAYKDGPKALWALVKYRFID